LGARAPRVLFGRFYHLGSKGTRYWMGTRGLSQGKFWRCFMQIIAFFAISAYQSHVLKYQRHVECLHDVTYRWWRGCILFGSATVKRQAKVHLLLSQILFRTSAFVFWSKRLSLLGLFLCFNGVICVPSRLVHHAPSCPAHFVLYHFVYCCVCKSVEQLLSKLNMIWYDDYSPLFRTFASSVVHWPSTYPIPNDNPICNP